MVEYSAGPMSEPLSFQSFTDGQCHMHRSGSWEDTRGFSWAIKKGLVEIIYKDLGKAEGKPQEICGTSIILSVGGWGP